MPRSSLILTLSLLVALALAACAVTAPPAQEEAAGPVDAAEPAGVATSGQYQEAPMLAERVAAGELPPVDDRLPDEPFVVGPGVLMSEENLPDWEPGRYGGVLRSAHFRPDWNPDIFVMLNEPLLSSPDLGVDAIRGNVLKDFEVNEDNTEFTFYMREGLKWSDGELVTTEDVRFVYEDIYLNENLMPSFPRRFRTGYAATGDPMTLEIVDDYTFKITFSEPYGGFLRNLTIEGWNGYTELIRPAHHLKQFHADYTPIEELRPLLDEQNLENEWWQVFTAHDCQSWDVNEPVCLNTPRLGPWLLVESNEPGLLQFERNPYYHKVDTEGKQLPYIDSLMSVLTEDVEMLNVNIFAGSVDFMRESSGLSRLPLYKENEERGGFRTVLMKENVDSAILMINQTFDDPVWREVVQDIRFRQAVSLAMDRQEMIDSLWYGFATEPEVSMGPEFGTQDVERANALLDEMGLDQRDAEGFRLGPDGNRFVFLIETGNEDPELGPSAELISQYLMDAGIFTQFKIIDPTLRSQRHDANELQASMMWSHDQGWDSSWTGDTINYAGRAWYIWRDSAGTEGEEPPDWVKEAFELDEIRWATISGSEEYFQLREQGYAWHRQNLPMITVVENINDPLIVSARMGNVGRSGFSIGQNFAGEQLFYRE